MTEQTKEIAIEDYPKIAVTGRVKTWLRYPERKTLNVSCTVLVANSDPCEDWKFVSKALRTAAGISLILHDWQPKEPIKGNWCFYIDPFYRGFTKNISNHPRYLDNIRDIDAMIEVADSMEEADDRDRPSIEESWRLFYECIRAGRVPCINLSALRPAGEINSLGLVASGAISFLKIYEAIARLAISGTLTDYCKVISSINEVLRRGGTYRNGAIAVDLIQGHSCLDEYLDLSLSEIPFLKKGLTVNSSVLKDDALTDKILAQVNAGMLWLQKDLGKNDGEQLYTNLCRGISLKDRGSCLISHVNLGAVSSPSDIITGWRQAMEFTCRVFEKQAGDSLGIYRKADSDRQVAVGVIGLANMLRYFNVSYAQFTEALEKLIGRFVQPTDAIADQLASAMIKGVFAAALIAKKHNMRAAFTVEPTASCAYEYQDQRGFTCCPNIERPVAIPGVGIVRRNSEATGDRVYRHGDVEVASEKTEEEDVRRRLWVCFQDLYNATGLAHMLSFELFTSWHRSDLEWWFDSPLKTTYYRRIVATDHLRKGSRIRTAKCTEEVCSTCGE